MQKFLSSKILMILLLMVLFLIAFSFIRGIIYERKTNHQQVVNAIARDHVQAQTLLMPFIVVPMTSTQACDNDNKKVCAYRQRMIILSKTGAWQNKMLVDNQSFKRGIYRAISYQNKLQITGRFELPTELLNPQVNQRVDWNEASLRFYMSDMRGLKNQPIFNYQQQALSLDFPKQEGVNPLTMPYTQLLLKDLLTTPQFNFSLEVEMAGTSSLQILPLGQDVAVTVQANWPDASFFGESLPHKQLNNKDFKADWQNTFLSNRNGQILASCFLAEPEACSQLQKVFFRHQYLNNAYAGEASVSQQAVGGFGVSFIQAVDVYLMTERAVKYALLFLVITFGSFFLFEILKGMAVHPVQYSLVGAALAVFYLLLLSFSEHIAFSYAYLIASIACIVLISVYVSFVLNSLKHATLFFTILTLMYSTLFVILQSEDTTLVLGAILLFVLLATMMFLTRHVDWYHLKQSNAS